MVCVPRNKLLAEPYSYVIAGVEVVYTLNLSDSDEIQGAIEVPYRESERSGRQMGAAGFEPAAAWSEAKYSVQAELSARIRTNPTCNNKSVGL